MTLMLQHEQVVSCCLVSGFFVKFTKVLYEKRENEKQDNKLNILHYLCRCV